MNRYEPTQSTENYRYVLCVGGQCRRAMSTCPTRPTRPTRPGGSPSHHQALYGRASCCVGGQCLRALRDPWLARHRNPNPANQHPVRASRWLAQVYINDWAEGDSPSRPYRFSRLTLNYCEDETPPVNAAFACAFYDPGEIFAAFCPVASDLPRYLLAARNPPAALLFQVDRFQDLDLPQSRSAPAPPAR